MKKLLAALLCCAMLLSAMPLAVAENGTEEPIEAVEAAVELEEADLTEEPVEEYAAEESEEAEATEEAPVVEEVLPEAAEDEDEVEALPEEEAETAEAVVEVAEEAVEAAEEAPEVALEAAFDEPVPEEQVIENAEAEAEIAANSLPADGIPIDETNFPDPVFRACILDDVDQDGNRILSANEIRNTYELYVYGDYDEEDDESTGEAVRSLEGIEYFTYLVSLNADNTQLTEVDLSQNTRLESLNLDYGKLTSLDVSANTELKYLSVANNQLDSLNISNNTELDALIVSSNGLWDLELSANQLLETLDCSGNNLKTLDVSNCPFLRMAITMGIYSLSSDPDHPNVVEYNYYTGDEEDDDDTVFTVTLDKNVKINSGGASDEIGVAINETNFPDEEFRDYLSAYYDLNDDGGLNDVECMRVKEISDFSASSVIGIEYFTNLSHLDLYGGNTANINFGVFTKLKVLSLTQCQINSLDLSAMPKLEKLELYSNGLTTLTLGEKPNLTELYCVKNKLTTIDLSGATELAIARLNYNSFSSLEVDDCPLLEELSVGNNTLTALDISNNTILTKLYVKNNKLTSLNLSSNKKLKKLDFSGNGITSLNVSACPKLVTIVTKGWVCVDSAIGFACFTDAFNELIFPVGAKITYGTRVMKSMAVSKSTSASLYISDRLALKAAAGRIKKITAISNKKVVTAKLYDGALTINGKAHGKSVVTFTTTKSKTFKVTVTVTDPTMPKKVTLDKTKTAVYLGHPVTLKATMTPSRSNATAKSGLTWKTSNAKIAKVSTTGKVTAVKAGTAKITVTTARGKKTATCTVTVRDPNLPKSIALDQKAVTVYAGEVKNIRLKSTLSWWVESYATAKKTKVTWTSSNKAVATVNGSGVVTPLKAGKVTITAKTVNGKSAACVVTITRNRIDNIHAAPTKAQIKKMASVFPCGYLKSVEIVNRNKIVLEWYLMNGKSKPLAKTPTMSMHVRYAKDVVEPATDEEDIVDEEEPSESIVLTDYDYKTVNVPANNYKLITVTLTPGNCYRFKSDIKLSTVKAKLDWYFEWYGE